MFLFTLALLAVVAVSGCTTGSGTTNTSTAIPSATIMATPSPTMAMTGLKSGLVELPDYSITINGGKVSPVKLSYADLMAMDFVEVDNASMMKMSGNGVEDTSNYVGVPIADILAKAGVPDGDLIFMVTASDDYSMNYTSQQLQNAILGLKQNDISLTTDIDHDPIVLVEPGQRGPMWTKVPVRIDIIKQ